MEILPNRLLAHVAYIMLVLPHRTAQRDQINRRDFRLSSLSPQGGEAR